jgi:hypothetical protein
MRWAHTHVGAEVPQVVNFTTWVTETETTSGAPGQRPLSNLFPVVLCTTLVKHYL